MNEALYLKWFKNVKWESKFYGVYFILNKIWKLFTLFIQRFYIYKKAFILKLNVTHKTLYYYVHINILPLPTHTHSYAHKYLQYIYFIIYERNKNKFYWFN